MVAVAADSRGPIARLMLGRSLADWSTAVSATPMALTITAASWLLIEKPALRLKDLRRQRAPALQPA